ncbi:flagellar export protein FliJ, partial [candidate division KSB1 bacterium]|nr:flagellar export protein FliJ [candidate division KSB1 bacterium]
RDGFTQSMNRLKKAEVSQFRSNQTYLETLNQAVTDKHETIAVLEKDEETKRQQLLEASKNRKALEKLKERKEVEVIHEENKIEQDFIDEIARQRNR